MASRTPVTLLDWLSDVWISTAAVSPDLDGATARGVLWQASSGRFLLDVPGVARYRVESGKRVTVEPAPEAAAGEVTRFLRMTPLAALLYQRGLVALHAASAVTPEGAAVLIAGDSGAGKSTLLAALLRRGWRMLGDELAIVDLDERGEPIVRPTFPEIRLWPDAVEKLGESAREHPLAPGSAPLRAIWWLSTRNAGEVESSEVEGAERFQALATLSYNTHVAEALIDRSTFFRIAAAVTEYVPLRRLRRPAGVWSVAELADIVEGSTSALLSRLMPGEARG